METTGLFLTAVALGVGIGFQGSVSPGPLQTLLISETLSNGVRSSWRAAFAPVMSDPIALTIALTVVMSVPNWTIALIAFLGAAILCRIAWSELKTKAEDFELHKKPRRSLFQIWVVNITNPNLWIYSFTVNGLLISQFWTKGGLWLAFAYLCAFFVTIVSCNLATVGIVGALKQAFNPKALVVVNRILGFALLFLALRFVYLGLVKLDVIKEVAETTTTFLSNCFYLLS
ncbi:MAG: LysE family transporter [Thermoguttaceae bacterium]|nr:LysE family transporter [Thermoguttaceae bacterium]